MHRPSFTFLTLLSLQFLLACSVPPFQENLLAGPPPDLNCLETEFYTCSSECQCDLGQNYYHSALVGISFIILIWCLLFIISFFIVKELREKPGDIILVLAIANFSLALKYIIEDINLLSVDPGEPRPNDSFCQAVGTFSVFFFNIIYLYQLTFYIYKTVTLRNPLLVSKFTRKVYHICTLLIALALTSTEFGFGSVGRTILGNCTQKTTSFYVVPAVINGTYLALTIYMAVVLRKNITRRRNDLNLKETEYSEHYYSYLLILCVILLGVMIAQIDYAERVRKALTNTNIEKYIDSINNLEICVFVLANLAPLVLTAGQIRDPAVLEAFTKKWSQIVDCHKRNKVRIEEARQTEPVLLTISEKPAEEVKKKLLDLESPNFEPQSLSLNNKKMNPENLLVSHSPGKKDPIILYSIFASMLYYCHLQKTQKDKDQNGPRRNSQVNRTNMKYFEKESTKMIKFTLHESLLKQSLPLVHKEIRSKIQKVRFGIFSAFAPALFNDQIEHDGMAYELERSLELIQNNSNIMNADTEGDSFQFITYNCKLVLRTITKDQKRILMHILPRYMHYLRTKPCSLLPRIYGLYRFEMMSPYQQINWIVMKNVSEMPEISIQRMYELTGIGSFRPLTEDSEDHSSCINALGDEDFDRDEQTFNIDLGVRRALLDTLKQDVDFLMSEGLVGYSLNVRIINKTKAIMFKGRLNTSIILEVEESLEEKSMTVGTQLILNKVSEGEEEENDEKKHEEYSIKLRENTFVSGINLQNPFNTLRSTKENSHYSLEIDNFLIRCDWERKLKGMFAKKKKETSLGSPEEYGKRFLHYLKQIIVEKEEVHEENQFE